MQNPSPCKINFDPGRQNCVHVFKKKVAPVFKFNQWGCEKFYDSHNDDSFRSQS